MKFLENILNINFSLAGLADILFYIVLTIVLVVSIILSFHWRRYGLSKAVFAITEIIYLVVCIILLTTAFFSLN